MLFNLCKIKCLHGGVVVVSASPPGAADLAIRGGGRGGQLVAARVRVFGGPDARVFVLRREDQSVRNDT